MNALARCVTRKGIADTTIADLVAESGLSAGAIYRHFKDKDEILVSLIRHRVKALDEKTVLAELGSFDFWRFVDWSLQRVTTTQHVYLADLEFVSLARVNPRIRAIYVTSELAWVNVLKKCIETLPQSELLFEEPEILQSLIDSLRAIGNQIILRRMLDLEADVDSYSRQIEMNVDGAFAMLANRRDTLSVGSARQKRSRTQA